MDASGTGAGSASGNRRSRFVYSWHLKRTPEEATEVEIRFVPLSRR